MEAIRIIVLAAASSMMLLVMMMMISSASAELITEEAPSPSITTAPAAAAAAAAAAVASAPLHRSDGLFTMQFRIGNTAVSGIADTGSDLIWTNNSQLLNAYPESCPASDNDGFTSPTSCGGLCTFKHKYGSGKMRGVMGKGKLTMGGGGGSAPTSSGSVVKYDSPDLITIGSAIMFHDDCQQQQHYLSSSSDDDVLLTGEKYEAACRAYERGGIVGLNRGALSLVSQLGLHSFSYCLPRHDDDHKTATTTTAQIKFYDDTAPAVSSLDGTETTLHLDDPAAAGQAFHNHYVVGLKQILVGQTIVNVPADDSRCSSPDKKDHPCRSLDVGAMLIDSATKYSVLPKEVFQRVDGLVEELLKKKTGKEIKHIAVRSNGQVQPSCYAGNKYPELDSIQLDLYDSEEGVTKTMKIPPKNYFYMDKADGKECYCLAFSGTDKKWSILGAYQQQDMNMVFDIRKGKNTLTFTESIGCGAKSQSQEDENHAAM